MKVTRCLFNALGCTFIEGLLFLRDEVDDPVMKTLLSLEPFMELLCLSSQSAHPPFSVVMQGLGSKTGPNGALQALAGGFHLFLTNF